MAYQLLGFQTDNTERGYDAERFADTLKEARREARYMLSATYTRVCESTHDLEVIQVWDGDTLVFEVWRTELG